MWRVWKFFQHCSFVTAWKLASATEKEIGSISQNFGLPKWTSEKITLILKSFSNFWDNNFNLLPMDAKTFFFQSWKWASKIALLIFCEQQHTVMYYILRKTERFCIYYLSCPLDLCKLQNSGLQNLSYEVGNLSFFRFCLQSHVRKLSCQCIQDYSSSNWPNHTLISLLDDGRKKHVIQTWYLWVLMKTRWNGENRE